MACFDSLCVWWCQQCAVTDGNVKLAADTDDFAGIWGVYGNESEWDLPRADRAVPDVTHADQKVLFRRVLDLGRPFGVMVHGDVMSLLEMHEGFGTHPIRWKLENEAFKMRSRIDKQLETVAGLLRT